PPRRRHRRRAHRAPRRPPGAGTGVRRRRRCAVGRPPLAGGAALRDAPAPGRPRPHPDRGARGPGLRPARGPAQARRRRARLDAAAARAAPDRAARARRRDHRERRPGVARRAAARAHRRQPAAPARPARGVPARAAAARQPGHPALRAAELVNRPDVALHHRSAAALGEDEPLASDLAAHARRQAARGELAGAAAAMLRASDLSPARAQRERRLLEGVDHLLVGGDVNRAATLTDDVRRCADGPYRRYVLGRLAFRGGRPAEARELLLGAWDACDRIRERELAGRIAAELALGLIRQARGDEALPWARRAVSAAEGTVTPAPWAHLAYALVHSGEVPRGLAELAFLPAEVIEPTAEQVQGLYARGLLRLAGDDLPGARADLAVVEPAARRWGPFAFVFAGLCLLAEVEYRLGCWDDAVAHAETAATIGEDAGQVWMLGWLHSAAAAPLAGRGEWERAREHVEAA